MSKALKRKPQGGDACGCSRTIEPVRLPGVQKRDPQGSSTGFATEAGWLGERVQPSRQDEVVVAQPVDRMSPDSDARPAPG